MSSNETPITKTRSLRRTDLHDDPVDQFRVWFDEASRGAHVLPEAMTLSTADAEGRPTARMVLLKEFDDRGFVFYTNFRSRKSADLDVNPHASLLFWWPLLERQVRIDGRVEKVSDAESDSYFASRPRGSQLGAWASPQSEIVGEGVLDQRLAELETSHHQKPIPRPPHWGGYRLVAETFEFWQGRPNRLHDRFRYLRSGHGWTIDRIAP